MMRFLQKNSVVHLFFLALVLLLEMNGSPLPAQADRNIEYEQWTHQMEEIALLTASITARLQEHLEANPVDTRDSQIIDLALARAEAERKRRLMYSRALYSREFPAEHRAVLTSFLAGQARYLEARRRLRFSRTQAGGLQPSSTPTSPRLELSKPSHPATDAD